MDTINFEELKEQIGSEFSFLTQKYGFVLSKFEYDPEVFGNLLAEFNHEKMNVRLIKDRGQYFLEFNAPGYPDGWYGFSEIMKTGTAVNHPLNDLSRTSRLLSEHLEEILRQMEPRNYQKLKHRIEKERAKFIQRFSR